MKLFRLFFTSLLLIGFTAGCADSADSDKTLPKIYTTIYPLQFLVEEIAGENVEAVTIYPPGVDEHTYEPTSRELTNIASGLAFFYIGAGLEAFADTAADALANQEVKLIEIGEEESLFLNSHHEDHEHDEHGHSHSDSDPHIWLDPVRMIAVAEIVADELKDLLPDESDTIQENFDSVIAELKSLDKDFKQLLTAKSNNKILVTHAAFSYWEDRYGIEQIAIHGVSTENEPTQKALVEIVDTANEHNLDYVIFEQNVSTRVAEVIQEELGAESLVLHNLSVLTEDDIEENRNYYSIMRDNLDVLDKAID